MRIWFKLLMALGLSLAFVIPLTLVHGVISERQSYRAQAVRSVMNTFAGPQSVSGPVLTVPYTENVLVEETDRAGLVHNVIRRQTNYWTFFPTDLRVSGAMNPSTRKRGIYEVPVYEWAGDLQAAFDAVIPEDANPEAQRVIGTPYLSYGISDVRGIRGAPVLGIDGRTVEAREGHGLRDSGGLHARLAIPQPGQTLHFSTQLKLQLAGAESLAVVPLGKNNQVRLTSSWQHPDFRGSSPVQTETAKGFDARWQLASIATNVQRQYLSGAAQAPFNANVSDQTGLFSVGVVLADPVDAYTRADRATKYGFLFVLLTFAGFFLFEVIKALPIHPIQYMLVGLAIAIFFLLLVSLSEHIAFGIAYLAASVACIGLIGFYLSAVLRSALRATGFATMLALLYGALYGLLISEDNALALGAGLLFAILAAVMVATRKVDWYRLAAAPARA